MPPDADEQLAAGPCSRPQPSLVGRRTTPSPRGFLPVLPVRVFFCWGRKGVFFGGNLRCVFSHAMSCLVAFCLVSVHCHFPVFVEVVISLSMSEQEQRDRSEHCSWDFSRLQKLSSFKGFSVEKDAKAPSYLR